MPFPIWLSIMLSAVTPEISERDISLSDKRLHYLEAGESTAPTVLLLHGARFSSETWRELGTVERLADEGYHVVALDLPGYGRSEASSIGRESFLAEAMDALSIESATVVSPSMSGQFSFPLVIKATDRVTGFVPVAPAGIARYRKALQRVQVPTLVVWGEKDRIIPLAESDGLVVALAGARRVILKGASHPCYLDRPDEFHDELLKFLEELAK